MVAPLMRWIPQASDLPARHRLRRGPPLPPVIEAKGSRRGPVSILRGCVADRLFREETLLSARLLALHGWRVLIPAAGCCGALHHHAGKIEESHRLSDERWRELSSGNVDHVIVDSAGCAAHLHARNDSSGPEVLDTATLLARTGNFETTQKLPGKSVVSSPCHQQHSARPPQPPRERPTPPAACSCWPAPRAPTLRWGWTRAQAPRIGPLGRSAPPKLI